MSNYREKLRLDRPGLVVMASVSGGKDSTAMSLWLKEQGIEHQRVFADTGWEHPETYRYVREVLPAFLGPILEVKAKLQMVDLVKKKGMFPSRLRRFCTQELKVKPLGAHVAALIAQGLDVVNAVGIRAAESKARSEMQEFDYSDAFDCDVWRPLIDWSEQDVIDQHKKHGCPPNPLYLRGAERVGCWPCIYARKSEIRFLADSDPERVAYMRQLEAEVGAAAEAREARLMAPSFFQSKKGRTGECWPIDKAVAWARTPDRGQKLPVAGEPDQLDLFGPDDTSEGCMRWGLCDTGDQKP